MEDVEEEKEERGRRTGKPKKDMKKKKGLTEGRGRKSEGFKNKPS